MKEKLGHKRVENSMKYIGMIHFKSNEFETAATTTVEEDRQAMTAGFTYVTERGGIKLWQRPKRFGTLPSLEDKRRSRAINLK